MINLYFGEDSYSMAEAVKQIKSSAKQADIIEIELAKDSSDKDLFQNLRETFENQGLFAKNKIVILNNLLGGINKFPLSEEYLLELIEKTQSDEIYFVQAENFDKRLKFYKKLQQSGVAKEFAVPAGADLEKWIASRFAAGGARISREGLSAFAGRFGQEYSLWQISQEIDKLALYCGSGKQIAAADVEEVTARSVNDDIFEIINLVAEQRNIAGALTALEQMLKETSTDLKSQTLMIIGALASQFRSLLLVKDLADLAPTEIAGKLAWKPGRVWVMQKLAKRFTNQRLRRLISDLKAMDMRLKTSEEPPKLLLTLFFQKVAAT